MAPGATRDDIVLTARTCSRCKEAASVSLVGSGGHWSPAGPVGHIDRRRGHRDKGSQFVVDQKCSHTRSHDGAVTARHFQNSCAQLVRVMAVVLLVTIAVTSTLAASTSDSGQSDDEHRWLMSARCHANCMQNYNTKLQQSHQSTHRRHHIRHTGSSRRHGGGSSRTQSHAAPCAGDTACSACLIPCDKDFNNFFSCARNCQASPDVLSCTQSCDFLKTITNDRAGHCPSLTDTSPIGGETTGEQCSQQCHRDNECDINKTFKCCHIGTCSRICMAPRMVYNDYPSLPHHVNSTYKSIGDRILVRWSHRLPSHQTCMYLVQSSYSYMNDVSHNTWSQWKTIAMTNNQELFVSEDSDIRAGRRYKFKVSAVNRNGSRGYSRETKPPIARHSDPSIPSPPHSLSVGAVKVHNSGGAGNNLLQQQITWEPGDSDLKVQRYKVFWHKYISGQHQDHQTEDSGMGQVVHASKQEAWLSELYPGERYMVEVQAIAIWRDDQLRSTRATLIFIAGQEQEKGDVPLSASAQRRRSSSSISSSSNSLEPRHIRNITVGTPFFRNGLLKAHLTWDHPLGFNSTLVNQFKIQWGITACLVQNNLQNAILQPFTDKTQNARFTVYDLRFDCQYTVTVQPVTIKGILGSATRTEFKTPSCHDVLVVGNIKPDCPFKPPEAPKQPQNLSEELRIVRQGERQEIKAVITWSDPGESDLPVTRFRLILGRKFSGEEMISGISTGVLDKNDVIVRELPASQYVFSHTSLQENSRYLVSVQAISDAGESPAATKEFFVPTLTSDPLSGTSSDSRFYDTSGYASDNVYHGNYPVINNSASSSLSASASSFLLLLLAKSLLLLLLQR